MKNMKKLFLVAILTLSIGAIFSSCASSRKTGCPMAEGIIH
jgi:hypothetical protein